MTLIANILRLLSKFPVITITGSVFCPAAVLCQKRAVVFLDFVIES
jgi:hypothetical protein